MNTNELREAAERVRVIINPKLRWDRGDGRKTVEIPGLAFNALCEIADAWLAEHDPTPIDRVVWVDLIGPLDYTLSARPCATLSLIDGSRVYLVTTDALVYLPKVTTRGDLRKLAAALGIPLNEGVK